MAQLVKKLKALFDFLRLPDACFISRLTSIHDKLLGNTAFPNTPVDLAVFLAAIQTFEYPRHLRLSFWEFRIV